MRFAYGKNWVCRPGISQVTMQKVIPWISRRRGTTERETSSLAFGS